jgi:hypothetical protein
MRLKVRWKSYLPLSLPAICVLLGWGGAVLAGHALWRWVVELGHLIEIAARGRDDATPSDGAAHNSSPPALAEQGAALVGPDVPTLSTFDPANDPRRSSSPRQSGETGAAIGAEEANQSAVLINAWPHHVWTECASVFVYIVTTFEHAPSHSAASLAVSRSAPARFRRPGQTIGTWEVLAITEDWTGLNPIVWLARDGEICRAELAGNPSRVHVLPKPPPKKKARRKRKPRRRRQ